VISHPRILIADDDRTILLTLGEGLEQQGFEVLRARDGVEAVEIARKERPDLALLDVRMPRMDGIEVARVLREELHLPFLFLSAYDEEAIVSAAIAAGALGYLVKPLEVEQVVPTLRAALSRASDLHGLREAEQSLTAALVTNREIGTAVGILMQRYQIDAAAAFESLRRQARADRSKLVELAAAIVSGARPAEIDAEHLPPKP
jgi:response regulator NasT